MLQLPAELLSLSGEPVLLIRGGKVLFANDAARGLLGRGCTEKSPQELFGGEVAGMQAPSFVGETEVEGRRVLLRVSAFSGVRAVFLTECGGVGPQLGSACLYALRSELMSLSASAAMLKSRLPAEDEAARSAFCCASQSFYRVNRMLRNLSVIRDAESDSLIFQPQPLDLCGLLREIAENVRQSGDTPELRLDLPERLVITGDAQLLELMVFNLLSNCLHHAAPSCIHIRLHSVGEQVILSVNDDGRGIPAGQLSTTLERYRCDCALGELERGPGFGLSAVRCVARLHGGTLLLESREGIGTAVRVSLSSAARTPGGIRQPSDPYRVDFDRVLTGLADCLPPEAFAGTFTE